MPFSILPLVQDANDVQVVGVVREIHHVRATQVFLEIRQDGGASLLCACGQCLEGFYEVAVVAVCLLRGPALECVEPDRFKIGFGQR